jgi:hypothetical protein
VTKLGDALHLRDLGGPGQLKPTVILLSATILLAAHRHFGTPAFWDRHAPFTGGISDPLFMFVSAFVLLDSSPLRSSGGASGKKPATMDSGSEIGDSDSG